jgi:hypothetical protein
MKGPGTLLGDAGTSNTGERRAIGDFKYAVFPTNRLAEVQAFERRWYDQRHVEVSRRFLEAPLIAKP